MTLLEKIEDTMITKNKIKARTALTIHVMGLANNVAATLAAVLTAEAVACATFVAAFAVVLVANLAPAFVLL